MKIAFLGTRGIPASYSGFETFVEQLGVRLAERGYNIVVFNRYPFVPLREKSYRGVRIIPLRTIRTKSLDTLMHSFSSCLYLLFVRPDLVYFCGVGNAIFCRLVKLMRNPVVVNVDGQDWARAKWSGFAVWWLRQSERWAAVSADVVIADSRVIAKRYRQELAREAIYLPYGANIDVGPAGTATLKRFGLTPQRYILFVGRLVPENRAELLIEAFRNAQAGDLKLAIVGDAPYANEYKQTLKSFASDRVVLTGYAFGEAYRELSRHCFFYVLPSGIEGTRPALLDQMGFGNCVVVRDSAANCEVIGNAGITFSGADELQSLTDVLSHLATNPTTIQACRRRAIERVAQEYDWETITDRYIALFKELTTGGET